jgi:endonuclease/exonuclease/phosphatase family metal-dependent hydrolase
MTTAGIRDDHLAQPSRVVELVGEPRRLEHHLNPLLGLFGRARGRRWLRAMPEYWQARDELHQVTFGLAWGRPARPAPRPARRFLRVMAWNVERGKRLDPILAWMRQDPLAIFQGVDVLLLAETDLGMARSGNRDVAAEIGEALGFEHVFGNSYLCLSAGNRRDLDFGGAGELTNRWGLHGNAVLSRYPLRRAENFSIAVTKDKLRSSEPRLGHKKALWAEVASPLGPLAAAVVHLDSGGSAEQRRAQMADVLGTLEARGVAQTAIVGGDFNTTTYDLQSTPRLLWNIASKLWRGGFPHAMAHYLEPEALYERAIFDELLAHGFDHRPFNRPRLGTVHYVVGDRSEESKVKDYLPMLAVDILRWKLRPWNGVAALKLDWLAGRGLRALGDGEVVDADGRRSQGPHTVPRPSFEGVMLSDHDPVLADVVL